MLDKEKDLVLSHMHDHIQRAPDKHRQPAQLIHSILHLSAKQKAAP